MDQSASIWFVLQLNRVFLCNSPLKALTFVQKISQSGISV